MLELIIRPILVWNHLVRFLEKRSEKDPSTLALEGLLHIRPTDFIFLLLPLAHLGIATASFYHRDSNPGQFYSNVTSQGSVGGCLEGL